MINKNQCRKLFLKHVIDCSIKPDLDLNKKKLNYSFYTRLLFL